MLFLKQSSKANKNSLDIQLPKWLGRVDTSEIWSVSSVYISKMAVNDEELLYSGGVQLDNPLNIQ